ncbi:hypothetical protein [Caulobacter sp. FWC2]|uniref:hypothetical protein n=1 Tax=Caulobacter sp. FWC2 TaxID=69664 RepID=UPI001177D333|nr:hypothetical protein [Caulobacter sp. FWC2]
MSGLLAIAVIAAASQANAGTIAACGPQKGHAYYPAAGLVKKGQDGWEDDQISGGSTTLTQNDKGELDVLFKDSRGEIVSSRDDGGQIIPLRMSSKEITVLVAYPEGIQAAEIYSFVREVDGKAKMLQLSSKSAVMIPKAAVYVADCTTLNLPEK